MNTEEIKIPEQYADISPFNDSEFQAEMAQLVKEPLFEHAVRYVMPNVNYVEFVDSLLKVKTKEEFQLNIMQPFLKMLEKNTTSGITYGGESYLDKNRCYTFISNHRDIVLDASFLNLCLINMGMTTTEIAIGNNLLVYAWISVLVRLNKSFIVKRDVGMRQTLEAALQLSNYIHFALTKKKQSIWIAQREGRAKDSSDHTQESLIKMLTLGGDQTCIIDKLKELNLCPVTISYEYDPNDYLKVREFLMKKRDPNFKKSQRDDLFSMETGLLQHKGHIHFEFNKSINDELDKLPRNIDRIDFLDTVCGIIDKSIHRAYRLYKCNYIAYDLLHECKEFANEYNDEEKAEFMEYIEGQLAKIDLADVTEEEKRYLHVMIYTMYSNPVTNYISAQKQA